MWWIAFWGNIFDILYFNLTLFCILKLVYILAAHTFIFWIIGASGNNLGVHVLST